MTITSRTPDGFSHQCAVCGKVSATDPSYPNGDSCCSSCGQLLWWFRDRISQSSQIRPESITVFSSFEDIGAESLDVVELIMELEGQFDINIQSETTEQVKTVGDAIRYLEEVILSAAESKTCPDCNSENLRLESSRDGVLHKQKLNALTPPNNQPQARFGFAVEIVGTHGPSENRRTRAGFAILWSGELIESLPTLN